MCIRAALGMHSRGKELRDAIIGVGAELQNAATENRYGQSATTHHLVHVYEILKTLIWFHFFNHTIFYGWLRPELRLCDDPL